MEAGSNSDSVCFLCPIILCPFANIGPYGFLSSQYKLPLYSVYFLTVKKVEEQRKMQFVFWWFFNYHPIGCFNPKSVPIWDGYKSDSVRFFLNNIHL